MASPNLYPNGLNLAGTVFANGPATLQLAGPAYISGNVQWLDTINGNNTNAGTLPELPVQTLAQAVTNSAANGIIIIGAGSSETLSSTQTINLANLSIFGCGIGSSRPRYTCNVGGSSMLNMTSSGNWIEGVYFPASTATPTSRVEVAGANFTIKDCYFECGGNDIVRAIRLNTFGSSARIEGCSFVVTASRPASGIESVTNVTDPVIINCTFDGGSYGWTDYALKIATTAATRIRIIGNTFTNRSDLGITVTGSSYQLYGNNMGGTGNVLLTA